MRSKVKTKQAKIKKYVSGTGGGPPLKTKLKPNEENILSLISEVAVNGHSSIQESLVQFDFGIADKIAPMVPNVHTPAEVANRYEIDHDSYNCNALNASATEKVIFEELPDEPNTPPKDTIVASTTGTPTCAVKKHTVSSARKLQVAASAAERLSETAKEKLEIKKAYYKRKLEILEDAENRKRCYRMLEIMEKQLIIEERKACALEKMSFSQ